MATATTIKHSSLSLWSLRSSVGKGPHWERERDVNEKTGAEWLRIYSSDEPGVLFCISSTRPRTNVRSGA